MRLRRFFLIVGLTCTCGFAQVKPASSPVDFDPLLDALKTNAIEISFVIQGIQDRGIAFDLSKSQLEAIVSAAMEGKRRPGEIAAVIAAALDNCQQCYARLLAPLSSDELLTLLRRGHDDAILLQEVKARGVKDLEISEANANFLRAAGANEEVVSFLVPDDKVKISPLIGYKTFELKHAEDYDPSAPEGWLKVTTEIPANSTSEFAFKHNTLFGRAVKGGEPTVRSAYFNKPTPRHTDFAHIKFTASLEGGEVTEGDEKRSGFFGIGKGRSKDEKAKDAPSMDVAYPSEDRTGRNSFQITLANKQSTPQQFSFMVRWTVTGAPQPLTAAPTKASPEKK
jgi:hypothetical protein